MKRSLQILTVVGIFFALWLVLELPVQQISISDNSSIAISSPISNNSTTHSKTPSLNSDNLNKHNETIPLITDRYVEDKENVSEPKVSIVPSNDEKEEVIEITLSPQQMLFYEEYQNNLNDESYLWNLNLHDFISQDTFLSLPEDMKMLIMAQIMRKHREGRIDKQKFLMK